MISSIQYSCYALTLTRENIVQKNEDISHIFIHGHSTMMLYFLSLMKCYHYSLPFLLDLVSDMFLSIDYICFRQYLHFYAHRSDTAAKIFHLYYLMPSNRLTTHSNKQIRKRSFDNGQFTLLDKKIFPVLSLLLIRSK